MHPIQKMLIGLSFENLLKGLLVAMGRPAREKGYLSKDLREHRMRQLINKFKRSELQLTEQEIDMLVRLENYVIWQGRYPVPCSSNRYDFDGGSDQDQQQERALWNKLRAQLRSVGWAVDVEGNKTPLNL
ncbi:MAG: hypothetical protein GXY44_07995 [Phycisphaerales bacterium]|nr:hypothetical protein [Phycisphaerales bacterium]